MVKEKEISIKTKGNNDIIDITSEIEGFVQNSGIKKGIVSVFVTGSTAGLTVMEFESGLVKDFKNSFEEIIPKRKSYFHDAAIGDGNGHSHVRASLLGPSITIPITSNKMRLGTWQQVVLIDFDVRERERTIVLEVIGE